MSKKHNAAPVNEIDETIKASTSFIEKHLKTIVATIGGVLAIIIICLVVNQYYIQPNKIESRQVSLPLCKVAFRLAETVCRP